MDCDNRLYVEIVPLERGMVPHPHPITEGRFDPSYVYKVLGMYNPSETSECYLMLANPQRELWFIPQRHTRAYALIDSLEFFLPLDPCVVRSTRAVNGLAGVAINNETPPTQAVPHRVNGRNGFHQH